MLRPVNPAEPVSLVFSDKVYKQTMAYLSALAEKSVTTATRELNLLAERWRSETQRHMPVDRGLAKASVTVSPAEEHRTVIRAGVGSNVPYIVHLEYGTKYIAAGAVQAWVPGMAPILSWPAKDRELLPGHEVKLEKGHSEEFMPPFRGSWALIAEAGLRRARAALVRMLQSERPR